MFDQRRLTFFQVQCILFDLSLIQRKIVFLIAIVIVNRFLLWIYRNACYTHFIIFIENVQYKY